VRNKFLTLCREEGAEVTKRTRRSEYDGDPHRPTKQNLTERTVLKRGERGERGRVGGKVKIEKLPNMPGTRVKCAQQSPEGVRTSSKKGEFRHE